MNRYCPGDTVELEATFRTLQLQAANPTTVVFYVQPPNGGVQTPAVSNPTVGVFVATLTIPVGAGGVGTWTYRVESTGNPTRALEGSFVVQPTGFAA